MAPEMLFDIKTKDLKKGPIYEGVEKTVQMIRETESLAESLSGMCALALQMALEADNVDPREKAYSRTKLYDSLGKLLHDLREAVGQPHTVGSLSAVITAIMDPATAEEDAEGDAL